MPSLKSIFSKLTGKTGFYEVNKTPEKDVPIVHRRLTRTKNSTSKIRSKNNTGRKTLKRRNSVGGKRKHKRSNANKRSHRKYKRSNANKRSHRK